MLEEWERLYFVGKSRDRGSTVAIREDGSDFISVHNDIFKYGDENIAN